MRLMPFILATLILSVPGHAFAQEWIEFSSREDRFTSNFPGQPTVTQTTWTSEYGASLPARVYSANSGQSRYTITVVDYGQSERVLTEKAKACPPGAETCRGVGDTGVGYWKNDVRGAVVYGAWKLMERPGGKLTHIMWNFMDMVAGQQLHLTNPDGSRTFASIYMHENKLLVMEGTVPAGYPEPGLFQQSLGWLDEQGNGIRYQTVYYNDPDLVKPPIRRRNPTGRNDGRIDAPGAPEAQGQGR